MIKREIGKTGIQVGVVGLGAEHLDRKPYGVVESVVRAALDGGVNIIDCFMPGREVRENIGRALGSRRKDVVIQGHIGSVDLTEQYDISRDVAVCRRYFEELLSALHTDYIDLGMMFFIDSEDDYKACFETGYITYVESLKKAGTIRAVGFSSHNPVMAKKVIETGAVDAMMFPVNLAYDMVPGDKSIFDKDATADLSGRIDPVRAALYETAAARGVGITTMKTYGAGKLLSTENTPFSRPMTAVQCIHYALSRPAVASCLVGCSEPAHVAEALSYYAAGEAERDYIDFAAEKNQGLAGKCMYCNHCQPCPVGIDIAAVNRFLDIALLSPDAVPETVRMHYGALDVPAGACISCGSCDARCPFTVPAMANVQRAAEMFSR